MARPSTRSGKGYFAIMIDQGEGMSPYSGDSTPLEGGSLLPRPRRICPVSSSDRVCTDVSGNNRTAACGILAWGG